MSVRRQLADRTVLLFTTLAVWAYTAARLQSYCIGWHSPNVVQTQLLCVVLLVALSRHRVSEKHKLALLIVVIVVVGFLGLLTFGLLAVGVTLLAAAAVLVSLWYSKYAVTVFSFCSLSGFFLVGLGFATGHVAITMKADLIASNLTHWVLYGLCLGFFYLFVGATILAYRREMTALLQQVQGQSQQLMESSAEREKALAAIKTLKGILPTCSHCKRIRPPDREQNDPRSWIQIETYIGDHSEARFSHGICPDCMPELYGKTSSKLSNLRPERSVASTSITVKNA